MTMTRLAAGLAVWGVLGIRATRSANGVVERSRPLCPYPQVAGCRGTGSLDDEASFVCVAP